MNTVSIARRAAMAATLTLVFCCGVLSTTPMVLADCGTQNGGPTCKDSAAHPNPSDGGTTADDGMLIKLLSALSAWIY